MAMWIGSLTLDLRFGDVRSLKEKRSLVRPIVAELRRKLGVSAAETGNLDLHRRAEVGVAVVAADRAHCVEVISACEQLVAGRPELEVLSASVRYFSDEDLLSNTDLLSEGAVSPGDLRRSAPRAPGRPTMLASEAASTGGPAGSRSDLVGVRSPGDLRRSAPRAPGRPTMLASEAASENELPGDDAFPGRGTLASGGTTDGEGR